MNDQMPRCATCKWWCKYDDQNICLVASPYHHPINDDGTLDETPRPEPKVEIGGGPIYTPVLYTDADYGCVQHEPKDGE